MQQILKEKEGEIETPKKLFFGMEIDDWKFVIINNALMMMLRCG